MAKDLAEALPQDTGGFRFMLVMVDPTTGSVISRWKVGTTATENGETVAVPAVDARQPTHDNLNLNANLQVADTDVSATNPVPVSDRWAPGQQVDTTLNDSDKSFTVPAGKVWRVLSVWVEFTSTATVGNRQVAVEFQDGAANVIGRVVAGATQAAGQTRYYLFAADMPDLTAFRDTDYLSTPLPASLELPAGYVVRVYDKNTVDAAADDMIVRMMVSERDA